ncbi:MAG: EamA family transporter RarD [Pseudomonadota bacterium]|jgi:chloramphenicol-sensitive protein RarD
MTTQRPAGGVTAAAAAYFIWGLFPLYWALLAAVPTWQLVAHRVLWCAVAVWLYLALRHDLSWWRGLSRGVAWRLLASGALLSVNWGVYVLAVVSGHVVETSLGYFITPLVNVLFGVLLLRERLGRLQWLAVACAAIGVGWLTWALGSLPWIALALALSFGAYGLLRKITVIDPVHGLAVESSLLLPPCVALLLWSAWQGTGVFLRQPWELDALLVAGGVVTAVPLVLFASGARRVPLTVLGFLQYIAPVVALLLGVFWFHEPFGRVQWVAFGFIWLALALFSADGLRRYLRRAR